MKMLFRLFLLSIITQLNPALPIVLKNNSSTFYKTTVKAGLLDATFGTAGKTITAIGTGHDVIQAILVQEDEKVVVGGFSVQSAVNQFALSRYTKNGILDTSFGTNGKVTTAIGNVDDQIYALAQQADGKIIAAGHSNNGANLDFALARYTKDGVLDTTFGTNGKTTTTIGTDDRINALIIQADNKIVAAGYAEISGVNRFALARYTVDGILDTATFGTTGKTTTNIGTENVIYSLIQQADGKIVAAGYASTTGIEQFALARYSVHGILDTTFGTSSGSTTTAFASTDDQIYALVQQTDGKIVAAGHSNNGTNLDFALARYTSNGILDTAFGTNGKTTTTIGTDDRINALIIQADGKIVAAGYAEISGVNRFALARYSVHGILDTTFGTAGKTTTIVGSEDVVCALAQQANEKIVAVGKSNNGTNNDFALARYTTDVDSLTQTASLFVNGHGGLVR